ncbi:MAG: hypothetical protein AAF333_11500 [Planctomycetota bacterium]
MLLPTTLLRHETAAGPHYDWLIVPPDGLLDPDGALWTARVDPHWDRWASLGSVRLTALPPHRRRYLRWQGALTGGRGHVFTAGRATAEPHLWAEGRIELTLRRPGHAGLGLRLEHVGDTFWRAAVHA